MRRLSFNFAGIRILCLKTIGRGIICDGTIDRFSLKKQGLRGFFVHQKIQRKKGKKGVDGKGVFKYYVYDISYLLA